MTAMGAQGLVLLVDSDPSDGRQAEWALEQEPGKEPGVAGKKEEPGHGVGPGRPPQDFYLGNSDRLGSGCIESEDSLLPNPRTRRYPKDDRQRVVRTSAC